MPRGSFLGGSFPCAGKDSLVWRTNLPHVSTEAFRVLVLEDDPQLREVLQALLTDEGYNVSVAESGEQAVELSRQRRFDVIVADIRMPGMDGLDTVQHLRAPQERSRL